MNRRSTAAKALARSHRGDRVRVFLVGLVALLGGALALVVGFGLLGEFRAQRPLLDPIAVAWLGANAVPAKIVAIGLGLLLLVTGLAWVVRTTRPEPRPDLALDRTEGAELTVTGGGLAAAVQADAETVEGVSRARARTVGDPERPALRLTVWLRQGSDARQVWQELDGRVLSRARESLGLETLPTAIHLELDAAQRQRVR
jgi:hypothetical protein